jgi:hypothetical protein
MVCKGDDVIVRTRRTVSGRVYLLKVCEARLCHRFQEEQEELVLARKPKTDHGPTWTQNSIASTFTIGRRCDSTGKQGELCLKEEW